MLLTKTALPVVHIFKFGGGGSVSWLIPHDLMYNARHFEARARSRTLTARSSLHQTLCPHRINLVPLEKQTTPDLIKLYDYAHLDSSTRFW
jgi:hypothetical protein